MSSTGRLAVGQAALQLTPRSLALPLLAASGAEHLCPHRRRRCRMKLPFELRGLTSQWLICLQDQEQELPAFASDFPPLPTRQVHRRLHLQQSLPQSEAHPPSPLQSLRHAIASLLQAAAAMAVHLLRMRAAMMRLSHADRLRP